MRILRAIAILAAASFASWPREGAAQPVPPAPPPVQAPQPVDCRPKAAAYQIGKGAKIWVLKSGTLVLAENPLRPLSRDEAVVLDVVVNGRRATAYGPDLNHLRQGGTPQSLEREGREPIRWDEAGVAAPALRVIAEDGRVLFGPMPFGGCEDAPAAKAVADKPVAAERPEKGGRRKRAAQPAESDGASPAHLPQGALQGLSLPKDTPRR